MVLVGSLFLRFWDRVLVPSSRACQDMKSVFGEGTAGMFVGSSQFERAKLVAVRHEEANVWAGGHCARDALVCFCIQNCYHFHHVIKVSTDFC